MNIDEKNNKLLGLISLFTVGVVFVMSVYQLLNSFLWVKIFKGKYYLNDWTDTFFYPEKKYQILAFVVSMVVMFFYAALIYLMRDSSGIVRFKKQISPLIERRFWLSVVLLAFIGSALLFGISLSYFVSIAVIFLLFLFLIFIYTNGVSDATSERFSRGINRSIKFVLLGGFIQLILIFAPYLTDDVKLINEYIEIPEESLYKGEYVNNGVIYTNKDVLGIERSGFKGSMNDSSREITITLSNDVSYQDFAYINNEKYVYDINTGVLGLSEFSPMTYDEYVTLLSLTSNDLYKKNISYMYLESLKRSKEKPSLTAEELNSVSKHGLEVQRQVQNRWMIHHHSYIYSPINEMVLGKPLKDIYMQYGLVNTLLIKEILEFTSGKVSFNKYFQVWYSFYIIYYAIFFVFLFLVLKHRPLFLMAGIIGVISVLNLIGFQFLSVGPGLNPIRHFFDVILLLLVMRYISPCNYINNGYAIKTFLLIALAVMSILNNYQTGVALSLSLLGMFLVGGYLRAEINIKLLASMFSLFAVSIATLIWVVSTKYDPLSGYYLNGLLGFPFSHFLVLLIFVGSIGSYFVIYHAIKRKHKYSHVTLFLFFYSQILLVYVIWGSTVYHFLNFAPIFILYGLMLASTVLDLNSASINKIPAFRHFFIPVSVVTIVVIIFLFSVLRFYKTKAEFENVFEVNRVYNWDFDSAKLKSTINPKFISDNLDLIDRYSSNNGIYILSKYDHLFTIVGRKYSEMPYFDLSWYLLSQKEVNQCIEMLEDKKPKYIYVDNVIADNKLIINSNTYFGADHSESLLRYKRLRELQKVFDAVKHDYKLVDTSSLISVYVRK